MGGGGIGGMRSGLGVNSGMGGVGGLGSTGLNQMGTTTPGAAGGANASFTDRIRGIIGRAGSSGSGSGTGDIQVIGQTKIISDERTNSLLIYATRDDMKIIRKIIDQLDVVLAQVLIEAVILEVTLDDTKNFGVSYVERRPHSVGNYFSGNGVVNNGNNLSSINPFSGLTNATASSVPGGLSYLGSFGNDLDVTVTALAGNSKARILQRPRIQTSHAVQASLFVGESRPYPTGSYYGGGAYGGYSSIQQMQIGVSLDVTPLINPDGLVVMDIHQKIDSVSGTVNIANIGDVPVTSSKEAQAKVAVRDHDTIMLGGLINTSKTQSDSGVPYLKDVPLLGALFRSSSKEDTRDELIVLIRPTVLPTPEVAALVAKSERNHMPAIRESVQEFMQDEKQKVRATEKLFKGKEELELR
jgi:general secretion pathway protein D